MLSNFNSWQMKILFVLVLIIFLSAFSLTLLMPDDADAALYPVTALSPDGHTRLFSDGTAVMVYHLDANGNILHTIEVHETGIFSFTFMDNASALMNREDGHLFVLQTPTGAYFHLSGPSKGTPAGPTPSPCPFNRCVK